MIEKFIKTQKETKSSNIYKNKITFILSVIFYFRLMKKTTLKKVFVKTGIVEVFRDWNRSWTTAYPSATETWKTTTLIWSAPITTKPYVILSVFLILTNSISVPKTLIFIHATMLIMMIAGFGWYEEAVEGNGRWSCCFKGDAG